MGGFNVAMSRAEWQRMHRLAVWQACEETADEQVVLSALIGGFPINTDLDGTGTAGDYTPLHASSKSGFVGLVDLLIDKGANIHALANLERTPLHFAALCDHTACCSKLLEAKADVTRPDLEGKTALQLCQQYHPESSTTQLLLDAQAQTLIKPKSPMLGPRKQAQLELEFALAEASKRKETPKHMHGASHMPWQPRNNTGLTLFNVGVHGTKLHPQGAVSDNRGEFAPENENRPLTVVAPHEPYETANAGGTRISCWVHKDEPRLPSHSVYDEVNANIYPTGVNGVGGVEAWKDLTYEERAAQDTKILHWDETHPSVRGVASIVRSENAKLGCDFLHWDDYEFMYDKHKK